jgi:hypothetical protein
MDIQKNRLAIASAALVVLSLGLYFGSKSRDAAVSSVETDAPELPSIDANVIREIAITRPGQPTVRLTKAGDVYNVTAPLQSATDSGTVNTAIEKLTALEVVGVAATNAQNHATLEVDDANAVRVVVSGASGVIADLRIGAFRGGNTMVRVGNGSDVLAVAGSIKFAFNRELREWRNRSIVNVEPANVRAVTIAGDRGSYRFERNASNEWVVAAGQPAIERFSAQKVETLVGALAHLRANDFAADGASTGLATPRATVTLSVAAAAPTDGGTATAAEEIVLLLGGAVNEGSDGYVQRRGNPLTYTVASYAVDRMRPALEDLQEALPVDGGTPPPAAPEMPPGGPGGGQIPPELLEQIQRQMGGQMGGSPH